MRINLRKKWIDFVEIKFHLIKILKYDIACNLNSIQIHWMELQFN
jgi:hypothetical protein